MRRLLLLLLLALTVSSGASCGVTAKSTDKGKDSMNAVKKLQMKDSGTTVKMSTGEKFQIVLDANATAGYKWDITSTENPVIKLVNSAYKVNSDLIGAGGQQIYYFAVSGKGKTKLQIVYRRPWEKDVKPVKTFDITIIGQ
jgi:inhibitor of cysteine peptidase